jgi:hypothetical protein
MRARPLQRQETRRPAGQRRSHQGTREAEVAPGAAEADPETERDLRAERRIRESGGPDDNALYNCSCGFVFEASVSTTVSCPHCGALQAW